MNNFCHHGARPQFHLQLVHRAAWICLHVKYELEKKRDSQNQDSDFGKIKEIFFTWPIQ